MKKKIKNYRKSVVYFVKKKNLHGLMSSKIMLTQIKVTKDHYNICFAILLIMVTFRKALMT